MTVGGPTEILGLKSSQFIEWGRNQICWTKSGTRWLTFTNNTKNSKYAMKSPLTKQYRDALHMLRKDYTLIIGNLDKGGRLVLMNKADNIEKMYSILNDPTKFKWLNDVKDINMEAEKLQTNSLKELEK